MGDTYLQLLGGIWIKSKHNTIIIYSRIIIICQSICVRLWVSIDSIWFDLLQIPKYFINLQFRNVFDDLYNDQHQSKKLKRSWIKFNMSQEQS